MLKGAIPVLHVRDCTAAADFYERMGFVLEFSYRPDSHSGNPGYLGLLRDEARIHLSSFPGDAVSGGVAYVLADDVDALKRELDAAGVPIDSGPVDQTWGMRELYVRDADGNTIRFAGPVPRRS